MVQIQENAVRKTRTVRISEEDECVLRGIGGANLSKGIARAALNVVHCQKKGSAIPELPSASNASGDVDRVRIALDAIIAMTTIKADRSAAQDACSAIEDAGDRDRAVNLYNAKIRALKSEPASNVVALPSIAPVSDADDRDSWPEDDKRWDEVADD